MPDLLSSRFAPPAARAEPDPAFAARARLLALAADLRRAARPTHWREPDAFFFDRARQTAFEDARGPRTDALAERLEAEVESLCASADVRRAARAVPGLREAAAKYGPARALAELLAVPDDEVFLALAPAARAGVRLHLSGVATVAQLRELLAPVFGAAFQLFAPAALAPNATLPAGFAGCAHWLWPEMPLARVPRIDGERVVLVGPAVVSAPPDAEVPFPRMAVACAVVEVLNPFRAADALARLCGAPVPVEPAIPAARAA
jgi:hypothetical protein